MSGLLEIEAVAELGAPSLRIGRLVAIAAGILAVPAIVSFLIWWLLVRPRDAQVRAATARVEAAGSAATAGVATGTLHIVTDNSRAIAAIDALTEENRRAIQSAPGASVEIDAALDGAGRAALCMRAVYRDDIACRALRGDPGGIGAAQRDAGSSAAGE